MRKNQSKIKRAGYSLTELLIAISLLTIVSALGYRLVSTTESSFGGGDGGAVRILSQSARKISERRSEAVRLNGEDRFLGAQKTGRANLLQIDFAKLETTASLVTEGEDANGDCKDDVSGKVLTCLEIIGAGTSVWNYAYRDDAFQLPTGWTVVKSSAELGKIPLIGGGKRGQGVLVTRIGFEPDGGARADECRCGTYLSEPTGSVMVNDPFGKASPFWAVYFMPEKERAELKVAVAVGVHPSGYVEEFRFDGTNWRGYKDRVF